LGYGGGYAEVNGYGNLLKVYYFINGYTPPEKASQGLLFRCAELALQNKKAHFVLYKTMTDAANGAASAAPSTGSLGTNPSANAYVLFLDSPRQHSFNAQKVESELKPVLKPN
jgi:hypothetical protein